MILLILLEVIIYLLKYLLIIKSTLENLAGRISNEIEADSLSLLKAMTDKTFLAENKFNEATALGMYLPNSYEVFWNTRCRRF